MVGVGVRAIGITDNPIHGNIIFFTCEISVARTHAVKNISICRFAAWFEYNLVAKRLIPF